MTEQEKLDSIIEAGYTATKDGQVYNKYGKKLGYKGRTYGFIAYTKLGKFHVQVGRFVYYYFNNELPIKVAYKDSDPFNCSLDNIYSTEKIKRQLRNKCVECGNPCSEMYCSKKCLSKRDRTDYLKEKSKERIGKLKELGLDYTRLNRQFISSIEVLKENPELVETLKTIQNINKTDNFTRTEKNRLSKGIPADGYPEKECDHCKSLFKPRSNIQRFCCKSCNVKFYSKRKNRKKYEH